MTYQISLYTDGAARGNPGPGGYGAILDWQGKRKELSEGFRLTTNNRMELLAVIVGIEALKVESANITVYTDSKYVADTVEKKWLFNWVRTNFKGKKNKDLWQRFLPLYEKHKIRFVWIKGHNNHPENERCDELAVFASKKDKLQIDKGYEAQNTKL
ncbi:MAG: ribonuclease HI [Bacteroidales bacterium]|nr:ribonuclease HI [Bacteroidales bacterium]